MENEAFVKMEDEKSTPLSTPVPGKKKIWKVRVKQISMELNEMTKHTYYNHGEHRENRIHLALQNESIPTLEKEIEEAKENEDIDGLDHQGFAALHHATRYNRIDAVKILLKNGACADVRTKDDCNTPLHIASRFGWLEVIKLLLDNGADPTTQNTNGSTPLHLACRRSKLEVITLLLNQRSVNVNARDKLQLTPLHLAAAQGCPKTCQMLMDHGADVFAVASDQTTPLHSAIFNGNDKCGGNSVADTLLLRVVAQNTRNVDDIIKSHDMNCNTLLHNCALTNSLDVAKKIIELGADVNALNTNLGTTPLHVACAMGGFEMAKMLVEMKAALQPKDCSGQTPLHRAAMFGHVQIIEYLLDNGADVDPRDKSNQTPFLVAVASKRTNCLKALLAKQSRLNFRDEDQKTALYLAAENNRAEHVEVLGLAGSSVNERNEEGKTPLHAAACNGNRKVCKVLIKLGADINSRDDKKQTPLMCAAVEGCAKTCKTLLENNANMDDTSADGETPLLIAVRHNNGSVVEMLMDLGVNVKCRNVSGMGVVEMAGKWNAVDAVKAVCRNKRWREVLEDNDSPTGVRPMQILINSFPEAAAIIMNKCIKKPENINPRHQDYTIEYDFTLLDPGPDDPVLLNGKRYFGPLTMVEHHRRDLLLHPLTQTLLDRKWKTFGSYIFYFSFIVYLVFLVSYSYFIITERQEEKMMGILGSTNSTLKMSAVYEVSGTKYAIASMNLAFVILQIAREMAQIILQGRSYFKDYVNFIEWMLYTSATLFLIPYVAPDSMVDFLFAYITDPYSWWLIALVSIFLCFINFVLFLRRFNMFGIYISMFLEVLRSVVKVMLIFIEIIMAFAIAFFILFKEQPSFNSFVRSFVKTTVMTLGEIDFTSTFVDSLGGNENGSPENPYPQVALVFCLVFMLAMSISLMNLLVGLAVGDIEMVRRNAELKRLARQVKFVAQIEDKYPKFITRMIYKPRILVKPNEKNFRKRLQDIGTFWVATLKNLAEEDLSHEEELANTSSNDFALKLEKNRQQIKALVTVIESQTKLLNAVANRIDPRLVSGTLGDDRDLDIAERDGVA
ncbi:transient receptor potential cation channel subfamily A member 1-like isoform X2 [Actinia tenebrosa]|uniref:Transient receptor potential cation channel subfamily A member 1-like isoform X2 n=1 Tax=Actinia tenebrosa TaxID=6105 RepID=A0A6P8HQ90_ACTTE|nr:transient receptor potential cation channel subfamily A member 1-like isoform X2 [Actinia tenebrosa]